MPITSRRYAIHCATALICATTVACAVAPAKAQQPAMTIAQLDGQAGGKTFEGIGIVDGGGATSVLLKDYPEPQRAQILDLVYRPKFGASVSALYVEIPGDGNSTQGSMPSHRHTRTDLNYRRGFMWWVMQEARKRNAHLSLDGAAWSAPGWVGTRGRRFGRPDEPFFSADGVDYYISWLKGLRSVYGLQLDAIGVRNEKGVSYGFAEAFRQALDANGFSKTKLHGFDNWPDDRFDFVRDMLADKALRDAIDIPSAHVSPAEGGKVSRETQKAAEQMGKPLWDTEQHVYQAGYPGLISTVKSFNEGFIVSGFTRITDWYGIGGLYQMQPYSGEREALVRANWPWSGHYSVNPKLWAYAHYGQFAEIGWSYLEGASGFLNQGGSYVTLKSPTGDYSVVIETKDAKETQRLRLNVSHLSQAALTVWRSTPSAQFEHLPDQAATRGSFELELEPDAVYTLSTTRGQRKGTFDAVPALRSFPFPYSDTFDRYRDPARWGFLPSYFADIYGAFELAPCPARAGQCLSQTAPVQPLSWAPGWLPYTIIGDDTWTDYVVSADVYLKQGDEAGVMSRVNDVGSGYGSIPKGYLLRLSDNGTLTLSVVRGKIDKKKPVGDAEQQALIKASGDASEGGEKILATAKLAQVRPGSWHRLSLRTSGTAISASVDGKQILASVDSLYSRGMAGLFAGGSGSAMSTPFYDNFSVAPAKDEPATPLPADFAPTPIYAARQ